jgi:outer membrane lipoprotein LolB
MRFRRWAALASLSAAFVSGCVTVPPRKPVVPADAGMLAEQAAREHALGGRQDWSLSGRLGISNSSDSRGNGSGSLSWDQHGDGYVFTVNGGFGYDYRLTGDAQGAVLEGVGKQPIRGRDAEALMLRAAGWAVPLSELRAWVLGLRANGSSAQLTFGADRLPAVLEQDGWRVEYRRWDTTHAQPLPSFVIASKPPYMVKLSIHAWTLK